MAEDSPDFKGFVGELGSAMDPENPLCFRAAMQQALLEFCDSVLDTKTVDERDCIICLMDACITRAAHAGIPAEEFAAVLRDQADSLPAIFKAMVGEKH